MVTAATWQDEEHRSAWSAYSEQARRPLVSLAFVLPLLALYEGGVLLIPQVMRNGADLWLRRLLRTAGLDGYFLLPALTIAVLLAWHHTTRQSWSVPGRVLWGMLSESAGFGFALVLIAKVTGQLLAAAGQGNGEMLCLAIASDGRAIFGKVVSFSGAGIYEEVLFRLMLLPLIVWFIRAGGGSLRTQVLGGILATSVLFSLVHYVGKYGDPLDFYTFTFRFMAGAFFATLFIYRGFGIAAGCHALYDVFVGVHWA